MDKDTEKLFKSIKEDFNRIDERFNKQDELLNQIAINTATTLEIVKHNDVRLKDHERRIFKLQKMVSMDQRM